MIQDDGVESIANALKQILTLRKINLKKNRIIMQI